MRVNEPHQAPYHNSLYYFPDPVSQNLYHLFGKIITNENKAKEHFLYSYGRYLVLAFGRVCFPWPRMDGKVLHWNGIEYVSGGMFVGFICYTEQKNIADGDRCLLNGSEICLARGNCSGFVELILIIHKLYRIYDFLQFYRLNRAIDDIRLLYGKLLFLFSGYFSNDFGYFPRAKIYTWYWTRPESFAFNTQSNIFFE